MEADRYVELFTEEYERAAEEFYRLGALFKDVCWYNFETQCRSWSEPWRRSDPRSPLCLESHRYSGRESGEFGVWYEGTVSDAPPLPPQIVLEEMRTASLYMHACYEQISAPYDWAPGGKKYKELLRTTLFPVKDRDVGRGARG